LGQEALKEAKRMEELFGTGSQIRAQYIELAKQKRADFAAKLEDLKAQMEALEPVKNEKKALQDAAVEKEKYALDKYKKTEEEKKKIEQEEAIKVSQLKENQMAMNAFKELDLNNDGLLTYSELQQFSKFDQNEDGEVQVEEAKVSDLAFYLFQK
jgi:hypothetical protein